MATKHSQILSLASQLVKLIEASAPKPRSKPDPKVREPHHVVGDASSDSAKKTVHKPRAKKAASPPHIEDEPRVA